MTEQPQNPVDFSSGIGGTSDNPDAVPSSQPTGAISGTVGDIGVQRVIIASDPVIEASRLSQLAEPFPLLPFNRPLASQTISPDRPGNLETQRRFVSEKDLKALWDDIGKLQTQVVERVRADRNPTDTYQKDLLYASSLLLRSEANYEEARQIYYIVSADLARESKVNADIRRYRLLLVAYHLFWLVITVLAIGLDNNFRAIIPESTPILQLAWIPILSGVFGAIFNGMLAVHEHTAVRRDFDPSHVTWYLLNPIMGGMLGLVVFIFFVVTGNTFNSGLSTQAVDQLQNPMVIWLLAFVVGWQQNIVFQLLNRFLKSFINTDRQASKAPTDSQTDSNVPN